jgi:hypothetical protein
LQVGKRGVQDLLLLLYFQVCVCASAQSMRTWSNQHP